LRRILTALLTAACLLLGLAGCGAAPYEEPWQPTPTPAATATPEPEPAQFALACYPQSSFHPITGGNRTNLSLGGLLYEGLFALDPQFQVQNVLCESYTVSEDALKWTFVLRAGVRFSDGSALTAADVAASLNQARASALYSARFTGVTGVSAGEGTVSVTLSSPNGGLPALLDVPVCKGTGERPAGTGPYVLAGEADALVLEARTDWWQGNALPRQSIPLRSIQEADDLIRAFDTRDVALVATDLTGTNALGFSGSFETVDYPTSTMLYVGFNTASGPCRDAGLRRALQQSFDRDAVVTAQFSRHALAAALPVSPVSPLYDGALAGRLAYSSQALAQALAGAGWSQTDGSWRRGRETLALRFVVPGENTDRISAAEQLAKNLTDEGVSVELKKLSWEDYTAVLARGDFDLYLAEVRLTGDFDLTALLAPTGALNYGGYQDASAAGLLSAFRAADGAARGQAAGALYEYLAQEPPFAVICFKNWSLLTQWRLLTGLTPTQQNVFYRFADWTVA